MERLFYGQAPDWLNHLFESEENDATAELKAYSEKYRRLQESILKASEEYHKLFRLMEDDIWEGEVMTEQEAKMLCEIFRAKMEEAEYFQRIFYLKGFRMGIRLARYLK